MWNSKKEDLCVVCDVGSATVSAALVLFSDTQKPKILFTTFLPIAVTPEPDLKHLEILVSAYIKKAFETLSHQGLVALKAKNIKVGKVEKVFISFTAPWFVSKTAKRMIANTTPFTFDHTLIESTLKQEEEIFEREVLDNALSQTFGKDMRMIERTVTHVALNGYPTANPFGKQANVADVSLYMTLVPEKLLISVRDASHNNFHGAVLTFHSFPLVSFGSMSELFPQTRDYLFFDVAGEHTHAFSVLDGTIKSTASFPIGRNKLLRQIMKRGMDETIARSSLSLWKEGTLGATAMPEIEAAIMQYKEEWNAECKKVLQSLDGTASPWFLIADAEVENIFASYIKELNAVAPTVISLGSADLKAKVEMEKHVEEDPYLALQAIFANIHGELFS